SPPSPQLGSSPRLHRYAGGTRRSRRILRDCDLWGVTELLSESAAIVISRWLRPCEHRRSSQSRVDNSAESLIVLQTQGAGSPGEAGASRKPSPSKGIPTRTPHGDVPPGSLTKTSGKESWPCLGPRR